MIKAEKIAIYRRFKGDIDGLARSGEKADVGDEEWWLIDELLSGLHIIASGMASPEFIERVEQKLLKHVSDEQARKELRRLSKKEI